LVLTAEQVAAAVASGCVFEPASPAAVQRLAMQRKVFYIDGQAVLAGRGDGLFETVGTLMQLIDQGRQVLAYQGVPVAAPPAEAPQEEQPTQPEPAAAEAVAPGDAAVEDAPAAIPLVMQETPAEAPAAAHPRKARRRTPPAPTSELLVGEEPTEAAPLAPDATIALDLAAAQAQMPARRPGRAKPRWVTAGAERRGRRDNHWSSRQK
jgi:hypothetical protein